MKELATIKEPVLRELLKASAEVQAIAVGEQQGFVLQFRFGSVERALATSRGNLRLFASLDTAGAFIKDVGISSFGVDMTHHLPGRLRSPRPDRAAALRGTRTRPQQQPLEFEHEQSASL
jgi:hypothetical protein